MSDMIEKFRTVARAPYEWAESWKEANQKKVVGVAPMHLPEELIHAAGVLPIIIQESDEPVDEGYAYIFPYFCGFVRNVIDMATKGKYDFLDGLIFSDMCIQTKSTHAILYSSKLHRNLQVKYVKLVQPPLNLMQPWAAEDTMDEFRRLRTELAQTFAENHIDDESIRQSIIIYNKNRGLLQKLYQLRRENPGLLAAKDMQSVVIASLVMPKEEHSVLLEGLISQLAESRPDTRVGVRLYLSGHLCHRVNPEILSFIEDLGGIIVDDDLYTGARYFGTEDANVDGDPMEALVRRYMSITVPCPTRYHDFSKWDEYILQRARSSRSEGVIILQPKFCEPQMFSYPYQKATLAAGGMPHILIETEHEAISMEALRNKVQAFLEILRQK